MSNGASISQYFFIACLAIGYTQISAASWREIFNPLQIMLGILQSWSNLMLLLAFLLIFLVFLAVLNPDLEMQSHEIDPKKEKVDYENCTAKELLNIIVQELNDIPDENTTQEIRIENGNDNFKNEEIEINSDKNFNSSSSHNTGCSSTPQRDVQQTHIFHSLGCLSELTNRCRILQEQKQAGVRNRKKTVENVVVFEKTAPPLKQIKTTISTDLLSQEQNEPDDNVETISAEACYVMIEKCASTDEVISAAFALLSLVANNKEVKRRHYPDADFYDLATPIDAMRQSLLRTKETSDVPDEDEERMSAEIQRRGCLMIGSFADGDPTLSTQIVCVGGLMVALDAMDWFRYHEEVANWSMWCVFNLCYNHRINKAELIRLGGMQKVFNCMTNNVPQSLGVQRHSFAILFDLMRQNDEIDGKFSELMLAKIRTGALNGGVHKTVVDAMHNFPKSNEIMMMGTQMLLCTGYRGQIPQYTGNI